MTRLASPTRPRSDVTSRFDLEQAFKFLGSAPSHRELGMAADLLRESGVEVVYDQELQEIAIANGSSAIDALDLSTAVAYGVEALSAGPEAKGNEK